MRTVAAPGRRLAPRALPSTAAGLRTAARVALAPRRFNEFRRRQVNMLAHATPKVSELPSSLQKIVGAFQMVPDPMARYKQLLFYASKLPPMPSEDHIPANKVEGCTSQVWVKPQIKEDGKVYWSADSDSQLTKGLAALLVLGLSGCTPAEVVSVQPEFIEMLGLKQSLTPSRNNGFLNMLRLMQKKCAELAAGGQAAAAHPPPPPPPPPAPSPPSPPPPAAPAQGDDGSTPAASTSASRTPITDSLRTKLTVALQPTVLTIVNQSDQHAGHAGVRTLAGKAASTGETHFRVEIVSAAFESMTLVKRQRAVYQLLAEEFSQGLHALSLDTKTPAEAAKAAAR